MKKNIAKKKIAGLLALGFATAVAVALAGSVPQNLNKAIEAQRTLVDERPSDAAVLNDYANLLMLAGRSAEAEAAYLDALAIEPDSVPARFNLALLLQRRGKARLALDEYRKVFDLAPDHAWAAYQIGSIHEAAGDERRAVDWYARSFALDSRLFLADYNPQVIDNGLVERAMLAGGRQVKPALAPRIYEEPARIRRLLVALPEGEEGEDEAMEEDEEIDPVDVEGSVSRVLETDDLDDRAVNQASGRAGGPSSNRRFSPRTRSRTWSSPSSNRPSATEGNRGGTSTQRQGTQRQGGSTFRGGSTTIIQPDTGRPTSGTPSRTIRPRVGRPLGGTPIGTASTGRLEIDWMPEGEDVLPG
ncbi:MAG: tetratricopeptide repeat protein [Acidobacteriota bacterium]